MAWLAPALSYVVVIGALGVTSKLALRDVSWQALIVWTAFAYGLVAVFLAATGQVRIEVSGASSWALATGCCAVTGLVLFSLALSNGEASRVVPVTAAYPLVTAALAAVFLAERVTPLRGAGALLVVAGVAILSR